jgi:hypothetical protein
MPRPKWLTRDAASSTLIPAIPTPHARNPDRAISPPPKAGGIRLQPPMGLRPSSTRVRRHSRGSLPTRPTRVCEGAVSTPCRWYGETACQRPASRHSGATNVERRTGRSGRSHHDSPVASHPRRIGRPPPRWPKRLVGCSRRNHQQRMIMLACA